METDYYKILNKNKHVVDNKDSIKTFSIDHRKINKNFDKLKIIEDNKSYIQRLNEKIIKVEKKLDRKIEKKKEYLDKKI